MHRAILLRHAASAATVVALAATGPLSAQASSLTETFSNAPATGQSAPIAGTTSGFGWTNAWVGADHPIDGLNSWWPLEAAAGDVGPMAAHGVGVGAQYVPDPAPIAWSSGSVQLDTGSYIDLSPHVDRFASMLRGSIACWVKCSTELRDRTILSFSNAQGPEDRFARLVLRTGLLGRSGILGWEVEGDFATRGKFIQYAGPLLDNGAWHHIAITAAGDGTAMLYIDGSQGGVIGPEAFLGYVSTANAMLLGRLVTASGPQDELNGQIDDLAIWDDALTADEVRRLADGSARPDDVTGPQNPNGPELIGGSLDSLAFASRGLTPTGGRFVDSVGNRAIRAAPTLVDYDIDSRTYLSFLVRRDDRGGAITPFELQLSGPDQLGTRIGWDATGQWIGGHRVPIVQSNPTGTALDGLTYFVVAELVTESLASGNDDWIRVKVYGPSDTVHVSSQLLSGQGTGPDAWNINSLSNNSKLADAMFLTLLRAEGGGTSLVEVDEIRMGPTWDSVTRAGYGQGCQGLEMRQSGVAALGDTVGIELIHALAGVPAVLHVGTSARSIGGVPLPVALDPFGAAGCSLLQSSDVRIPAWTDAFGAASIPLAVPNNPALRGTTLFAQWSAIDRRTQPLGISFADGLALVIGD